MPEQVSCSLPVHVTENHGPQPFSRPPVAQKRSFAVLFPGAPFPNRASEQPVRILTAPSLGLAARLPRTHAPGLPSRGARWPGRSNGGASSLRGRATNARGRLVSPPPPKAGTAASPAAPDQPTIRAATACMGGNRCTVRAQSRPASARARTGHAGRRRRPPAAAASAPACCNKISRPRPVIRSFVGREPYPGRISARFSLPLAAPDTISTSILSYCSQRRGPRRALCGRS
jgi:hypothetical protein